MPLEVTVSHVAGDDLHRATLHHFVTFLTSDLERCRISHIELSGASSRKCILKKTRFIYDSRYSNDPKIRHLNTGLSLFQYFNVVSSLWLTSREGVIIEWPLNCLFHDRRDVIIMSRMVVFRFSCYNNVLCSIVLHLTLVRNVNYLPILVWQKWTKYNDCSKKYNLNPHVYLSEDKQCKSNSLLRFFTD